MSHLIRFAALLALAGPLAHGADQPSPAEMKLRESLRNTMLQMRTLQGERDTLQADKDAAEADKAMLTEKLAQQTKESAAAQAAAEKVIAETQDRLAKRETDNAYLVTSLDKWKTAHREVSALAEKREAARAKLNSENIVLQRRVDDQMRKNLEMYKIGSEILVRYENFGLGTALTAREPFVGLTRVKLQNLVQDYGDKLAEQRIKPEPSPGKPSPVAAPAATPRKETSPGRQPDPNLKRPESVPALKRVQG